MKIERRKFFQTAGALGLSIPYWGLLPVATAQTAGYTGKILVKVQMDGGCDQSSWTDPRETDARVNNYAAAGTPAAVAGNIRMAPMGNNAAFLQRFAPMMLVINGVHALTNNHDVGIRSDATGVLDAGYPTLSELMAKTYGAGMPMPWLNQNGYATSAGLVAATPVPNGNSFLQLISPNRASLTNDFMKQQDFDKALAARTERVAAQRAAANLAPRSDVVAAQFLGASESRARLANVAQYIPTDFDNGFESAHAGLVAAQAGITATIQIRSGGFDGHTQLVNSYNGAQGALTRVTDLISYIWDKSATMGLEDRLVVVVGTDFGRTVLNNGNGKDHWGPGGTCVVMAKSAINSWGNRVVGATGPRHEPVKINPTTGAIDPSDNGVQINRAMVHTSLRKFLGVETAASKFNLKVTTQSQIDFFNPSISTGYPSL